MNQSRKGLWCVVIGSPSSRWPSLSSRGLCVRSLRASGKRSPRNVTRQGIREGTGGLSFLYRVSVISPAQRSDSPVGDVSSPAARSLAWALSLSLPLPWRGPGGHVTWVGTWPGWARGLPLLPNLHLEQSYLLMEVVRGWFILTVEPWRRGPFASAPQS